MEVPLEDIYHLLETNQLNKVREILVVLQPVWGDEQGTKLKAF